MTATTQSHHGINPKTHPKNIGTSQIPKPTAVIQNRVGKPHSTHKFGFTGPSRGGGTTATATGGGATGARGVGAGMGGGVGISLTAGARAGETSLRPRFRGGLTGQNRRQGMRCPSLLPMCRTPRTQASPPRDFPGTWWLTPVASGGLRRPCTSGRLAQTPCRRPCTLPARSFEPFVTDRARGAVPGCEHLLGPHARGTEKTRLFADRLRFQLRVLSTGVTVSLHVLTSGQRG